MAEVLVVDDDADLVELVSLILEDAGHHVRTARDGVEGLATLRDRLPEVIVLDVEMPQLDGPGMAEAMLIRDAGAERIPIVLVSGCVALHDLAARVGTPYYATKPCTAELLLEKVGDALRERRAPTPRAAVASAAARGPVPRS